MKINNKFFYLKIEKLETIKLIKYFQKRYFNMK